MRAYRYRLMGVIALLMLLAVSSVRAGGFTASIWSVAWSPDGKSLVYTVYKDGVYIANLDGEKVRILDADAAQWTPQWSPDGKSIITTLTVDNQAGIFRVPIKGGEPERLTEDVGWRPQYYAPNGMQPQISPDGKSIAFLSLREGDEYTSLYVMTIDGEDERALTDVGSVGDFAWSPDGQSIALAAIPDGYNGFNDLFVVQVADSKVTRLTTEQDVSGSPVWTPDGQQILFTAHTDNNRGRIDSIDADGSNRRVMIESGSEPVFSPDGSHIIYTSPAEKWFGLSIISASAAEAEAVTLSLPGEQAYYNPAWSPDSSQIAFVAHRFDAPNKGEAIYVVGTDGVEPQRLVSSG